MAPLSPELPRSYHVRSISLPARLHPIAKRIEEELSKLRPLGLPPFPNSKTISSGLYGIAELYRCIGDLFDLPAVQTTLSLHQDKKLMSELLDISLRQLDVCGKTTDTVSRSKENIRELQSALRRRKRGDLSIKCCVGNYLSERKSFKKEISKSLTLLKGTEKEFASLPLSYHLNCQFVSIVEMLREANSIAGLAFSLILSFLSTPALKPKPTKWEVVFKVVNGGKLQGTSELEGMEATLSRLLPQNMNEDIEVKEIQSALKRLEDMDATIGDLERELRSLFRRMIQTRVSLLNIISL